MSYLASLPSYVLKSLKVPPINQSCYFPRPIRPFIYRSVSCFRMKHLRSNILNSSHLPQKFLLLAHDDACAKFCANNLGEQRLCCHNHSRVHPGGCCLPGSKLLLSYFSISRRYHRHSPNYSRVSLHLSDL